MQFFYLKNLPKNRLYKLLLMTVLLFIGCAYAGNEANVTRSVEVINVTPTLSSLSLESNATTVNKAETIQLSLVGTYSDNSTNIVDENVTYIITPAENAEVNGSMLTALKDGSVTVQAKVDTTLSNVLNLNITWVVDGYELPPEPDKALNDSTLLGIDSNNNGVRDDVERKIYEKYPVKLQRTLLMDGARVFQEIAIRPIAEAKEIVKEVTRVLNCGTYLRRKDERIRSYNFEFVGYLENLTYNNQERVRKYLDYNLALSGGSYGGEYADINEKACSQEIIDSLKELGL